MGPRSRLPSAARAIAAHFFTAASLELRRTTASGQAVAALAARDPRPAFACSARCTARHRRRSQGRTGAWTPPTADGRDRTTIHRGALRCPRRRLRADAARRSPPGRAVAAVHAGWRARCRGLPAWPSAAMKREFGADPARPDRRDRTVPRARAVARWGTRSCEAFRAAGHDETAHRPLVRDAGAEGPHFDLWRANREQLEGAGLPAGPHLTSGLVHPNASGRLSFLPCEGIRGGPDGRRSIRVAADVAEIGAAELCRR